MFDSSRSQSDRDGVFVLLALHHGIGRLRARLFELRLRLRHVHLGCDALVISIDGELKRPFIGRHVGVEQGFLGIETMQRAYAHAIEAGYRFYSYGDACLLFRAE